MAEELLAENDTWEDTEGVTKKALEGGVARLAHVKNERNKKKPRIISKDEALKAVRTDANVGSDKQMALLLLADTLFSSMINTTSTGPWG
jgi:hypothetical protein